MMTLLSSLASLLSLLIAGHCATEGLIYCQQPRYVTRRCCVPYLRRAGMSSSARFRTRPNVASAARRRRLHKEEAPHAAAVADTAIGASAVVVPQSVDEKRASVSSDASCSVCDAVVANGALADSSFGSVCGECGAIADVSSSSSGDSLLLMHHPRDGAVEGLSCGGQWVSKSSGARGLGVTSQLRGDSSGTNRAISARQRVQQRVALLLSQLQLPSAPLRHAVLSLVEAVVGGRYGNGSSRWLELVCIACVYVGHRQHQAHTVAEGQRQALLTRELSALVGMDERLIVRMADRIRRQHGRPHTAPLSGAEYVPHLLAAVQWRHCSEMELLSRQRAVQHKAQRLANIAHKLDLQHGQSSITRYHDHLSPLLHSSTTTDELPVSLCMLGHSLLTLSAAAVSLLLLHPPHCDHHSHPVRLVAASPSSPSLLSAFSARAGVSSRVLRSSQRWLEAGITRVLLPSPLVQTSISRPLPLRRKRKLVDSVDSMRAPSLCLLLQQLDVLESCVTTADWREADSSRAEVRVEVKVELDVEGGRDSEQWTESGSDDDLSQYIRTEEEISELRQLETT